MISLFIDTSSEDVSIAIIKDKKILASKTKTIPGKHSIYTTSILDSIIKEAGINIKEIDKIMVVNGPGSFTGLRIGLTVAKVLAYLLNKEVTCISSLKMRSLSIEHDYCLSLIDARNNNYYLALYDKDNNEVVEPVFAHQDKAIQLINKYNPICLADKEITIDNTKVFKQKLDIIRIVNYYQDKKTINAHLAVPEYLKLPQAMEDKK